VARVSYVDPASLTDPELIADPEHLRLLGDRERLALRSAHAIAWDSSQTHDELWSGLRAHFEEPELVELGCAIGFELDKQHWRRTVGLPVRDQDSAS